MYCKHPGQLTCPYLRERLRKAPSGKKDTFNICVAIKRTNNIICPANPKKAIIEPHYRCPLCRE